MIAARAEPRRPHEDCDVVSSSDDYARRFAGAVGAWMLAVQADAALQLTSRWRGGSVLDVGGGHAQLAGLFAAVGHHVTILGSHPSCGERPRRLRTDHPVTFTVGDVMNPPFEPRSFDIVLAFRMMAHVHDWRAFLAGLCRVARRAVVIDFATPVSVNAIAPLLFSMKKKVETNTRRFALQRRGPVAAAFAEHGFTRVQHIGQYVAPMALHRMMKAPAVSRGLEAALHALGLARWFGSPVVMCAQRQEA